MNLTELIKHPEHMDRETLYDLRSLIALHPYYQTARILMLENLYLLHDTTFDEELRRAAIYITDRSVIFNLIEAAHYKLRSEHKPAENRKQATANVAAEGRNDNKDGNSRTTELIDSFLGSLPTPEEETKQKGRKPTPADAAVDYVAYLLESEAMTGGSTAVADAPQMKGQSLIDDFINHEGGGRIILPELDDDKQDRKDTTTPIPDELYTETMAQIYVRQGRYSQALEIIKRLNEEKPAKNAYFADQIRFLEKLVLNNKKSSK